MRTKQYILGVVVCALIGILPSLSHATQKIPPKVQSFITEFEKKKKGLQGGAIAILHKDQIIYKSTFGHQKGKTGPITSSTLFPLASVSKPVSAVALALMVDKGQLDFNQKHKISYLQNPVNLKHVLSHTTGYPFSGNSQIEQGMSRNKLLTKLKEQEPNCKPGQCYLYSNTTYSLVEEILNAQDLSLHTAIQKLRSTLNTEGLQLAPIPSHLSFAHPHKKEVVQKKQTIRALPFPPYYPKAVPAAAGVFGSLDGMIAFYKLSFGYKPHQLSQKTVDIMHTPMIHNRDIEKWSIKWPYDKNKVESTYGLGWRMLKAKDYPKKKLIFHGGMIAGAVSFIGYIPEEEIGVIILVNQNSSVPLENGVGLWSKFLT